MAMICQDCHGLGEVLIDREGKPVERLRDAVMMIPCPGCGGTRLQQKRDDVQRWFCQACDGAFEYPTGQKPNFCPYCRATNLGEICPIKTISNAADVPGQ